MRILITNDDGFGAPGMELLAKIASEFGEIVIVAPDSEQSGISHRLSFEKPLKLQECGDSAFRVNGTPADCVRVAVAEFGSHFDWVLSGINDGANLGCDIFYSGTVAAAREGCLLGIPAIALSQYRRKYAASFDWQGQAGVAREILHKYLSASPRPRRWISVNLPDVDPGAKSEMVECKVDGNPLPPSYVKTGAGLELHFKYCDRPRDAGTDTDVCLSGNIAVSHRDVV